MSHPVPRLLQRIAITLAVLVVLKVILVTVGTYPRYMPPDFTSDFLHGREGHFFGVYQWAFFPHIIAGPLALLFGLLLISDPFRFRWPAWHRRLGRVQVVLVTAVVVPSGLVMAFYAEAGPIAGAGFATLSLLTGLTTLMGWWTAIQCRFAPHRRWMQRSFLLLGSAVVIRVLGGFATVTGITAVWWDPAAAWASWLVPLVVGEVATRWGTGRRSRIPSA